MVAVAQGIREQVAWACRILASEGYADLTLGHVSARGADGQIWIKRKGVALDEVEAEDVVAIDDTGAVLHLETVLHTGVYAVAPRRRRRRPRPSALCDRARRDVEPTSRCSRTTAILFADGVGRLRRPRPDRGRRAGRAGSRPRSAPGAPCC